MPIAVVRINEWNANSVKTDKSASTIRFRTSDEPLVDSTFGMAIPQDVGRLYSFEKWLRLAIDAGSPANDIRNIKFYTDGGSFGSGINLWAEVSPSRVFRSAAQPDTSLSKPLAGSGSKTMTNAFVYTAGAGLSLTSAAESFSGTSTDMGAYAVLVMEVGTAASSGTASQVQFTFSYDTSVVATTVNSSLTASVYGVIAQTLTKTVSKDAVIGKPVDDTGFFPVTGVGLEIGETELLANDFTAITEGSDTNTFIDSVTGFVNGSATVSGTVVTFYASGTGTCAFHYVGNYLGTLATGSVSLTATTASTTTTASSSPISFFGPGRAASSQNIINLNTAGKQTAFRFMAQQNGVITGLKTFINYSTTTTGYSKFTNLVTAGPGGNFSHSIWSNNPSAGASGTATNMPLASIASFGVLSASGSLASKFTEMSGSCSVSTSGIYYFVVENTHSNPSQNFASINYLVQSWAPTPHNPPIPDLQEDLLVRNSSINTWTRQAGFPSYQIRYDDGYFQGNPYFEPNNGGTDEGTVDIGASSSTTAVHVRQTFVPDTTFSTQQFSWYGRTQTAVATDLRITFRQESNNALIGTISASVGTYAVVGTDEWLTVTAGSALTFSGSVTYHFTMSATAGIYRVFHSLRDGAEYAPASFSRTIATRGRAQISSGGTTYTNYLIDGSASDEGELPFYMTKT